MQPRRVPLPDDEPPRRTGTLLLLAGGAVVVAGVAFWQWRRPAPVTAPATPASASAAVVIAPRCVRIGDELVVGDAATAELVVPDAGDGEDPLGAFAAEIGKGIALESGFAVGVRHDAPDGAVAMVARLNANGLGGKLVKLGRTRGDLDPPTLAASGEIVLVAMLEAAPNGRTVRVGSVRGSEVAWGMTENETNDESLAVGLAASEGRGAVAWDDVPKEKRSEVALAVFDATKLGQVGATVRFAYEDRDVEGPQIAARPGGFWIAWVASAQPAPEKAAKDDGKLVKKKVVGTDIQEEKGGERLDARWIEALPVDLAGVPLGAPRPVTPKDGRVLAFDLGPGPDGSLLVAYTEGDTPSGTGGGRLMLASVRLTGVAEPKVLSEEEIGTGGAILAGPFVGVSSLRGPPFLLDLDGQGAPVGTIRAEPSLLRRELLAARGDLAFVAAPAGKLVRLSVMRCGPPSPVVETEEAP